ncbi:MAG: sigma-54-dependent Fis family transcriptional regulator [Deltaproteobacteria bacterium]|nr:sigma-54-dependent Fis family transcriptional regulator [Deltaproteobacteria bacterium]
MSKNILVIDDEPNLRHMLTAVLEKAGYTVSSAQDGMEALSLTETKPFDVILCDLRMPRMDGLAFLKHAATRGLDAAIIMMSAYGTIDTAVEAMKLGAADYISKPFKPDEILLKLGQIEERNRLRQENIRLRDAVQETFSFQNMVAKSKSMRKIFDTIQKIADYKTTVLITGESGTGKELIARAIHYNGARKHKPIVAVNCGGLPENLLESELFGHVKGAFTDASKDKKGLFQEASGGTLFLDEIAELPLPLQVKLLRVVQDELVRPVGSTQSVKMDVRIIAATGQDLAEAVKEGTFRDDLFYRINVLSIHVPPLRDRKEDIPLLLNHFVKKFKKRLNKEIEGLRPEALQILMDYPWPGNIRELENVIERTMVLTERREIHLDELPEEIRSSAAATRDLWRTNSISLKVNTMTLEKALIQRALRETNNNRTRAAKLLEISHPTLLSKMKTYGIS